MDIHGLRAERKKERKKEHKYVMHLETIHTFINGDYITVSAPFAVCYASTAMYLLYYFFYIVVIKYFSRGCWSEVQKKLFLLTKSFQG